MSFPHMMNILTRFREWKVVASSNKTFNALSTDALSSTKPENEEILLEETLMHKARSIITQST